MKDKEIEEMIIEESCSTIRGQISSGSWNAQQKKERIQKIVESALTTQKESFIKIIRETRKNIWAGLHERQEWAIKDEVIEQHIDKMIAELEREDR